jgi:hypothetical protein
MYVKYKIQNSFLLLNILIFIFIFIPSLGTFLIFNKIFPNGALSYFVKIFPVCGILIEINILYSWCFFYFRGQFRISNYLIISDKVLILPNIQVRYISVLSFIFPHYYKISKKDLVNIEIVNHPKLNYSQFLFSLKNKTIEIPSKNLNVDIDTFKNDLIRHGYSAFIKESS